MFFKIFLLFTLIPIIELSLLIKIGGIIGTANTIGLVILTALAGASLARQQGMAVLQQIQFELSQGRMPTDDLVNGAFVLVGGVLLLTPGILTDLTGILLLIPLTREMVKGWLISYLNNNISQREAHFTILHDLPDDSTKH
ncbi:MAG: FxsA family protein [bacterium]